MADGGSVISISNDQHLIVHVAVPVVVCCCYFYSVLRHRMFFHIRQNILRFVSRCRTYHPASCILYAVVAWVVGGRPSGTNAQSSPYVLLLCIVLATMIG